MRIGIDARLWNETGVGRYIRNLVWQLQQLDTKNDYVIFVTKGNTKDVIKKANTHWKLIETDIHWHSLTEQIKFPQVLYKEKLDLVHFPYFSLPIFYNKPFVVTIHDLILSHFPTGKASTLPYPLYRLKRVGYDLVLDHAVKKAKKIIVPLIAVKDDVKKTLGVSESKIVVTTDGVDCSLSQTAAKKAKSDNDYFLYVGNAYPHKNLDVLVEAFKAFKKDHTDVQLILVGKNDFFYKRLHEKIKREKIDGIIFKHDVLDTELSRLYSHAKAFISPSKMEGFGLPPLEAMSVSCPVLLSDIPAFREVCGSSAFYFDPLSVADLTKQMHLVYNLDESERQKRITTGLKRVGNFSWEKMAKETLAIYESSFSLR